MAAEERGRARRAEVVPAEAATARSSKRQRYNEPFTKDVCLSQAKFAKFLRSYAFN